MNHTFSFVDFLPFIDICVNDKQTEMPLCRFLHCLYFLLLDESHISQHFEPVLSLFPLASLDLHNFHVGVPMNPKVMAQL